MKRLTLPIVASALILPLVQAKEARDVIPSRMVGPDQVEQQIHAFSSRLAIAQRHVDPFGQTQNTENVKGGYTCELPPLPPQPQMPFAQVVDRIPVAALMPKEKRVMIAGKTYAVGQEFPVKFKGRDVKVEVLKVTGGAVDFRNADTGEVRTYQFNKGVEPMKKDELRADFARETIIELN